MKLSDFGDRSRPVRVRVNHSAQFNWQVGLTGKATLVEGGPGVSQLEQLAAGLRKDDQLTAWVVLDTPRLSTNSLELYLYKLDLIEWGDPGSQMEFFE